MGYRKEGEERGAFSAHREKKYVQERMVSVKADLLQTGFAYSKER